MPKSVRMAVERMRSVSAVGNEVECNACEQPGDQKLDADWN